jgi:hypothetical protein
MFTHEGAAEGCVSNDYDEKAGIRVEEEEERVFNVA